MRSVGVRMCAIMGLVLLVNTCTKGGVTNGSFETGDLTGWRSPQNLTVVSSWSGSGTGTTYWEPTDGKYFAVVEATEPFLTAYNGWWPALQTSHTYFIDAQAGDEIVFDYFWNSESDSFDAGVQLLYWFDYYGTPSWAVKNVPIEGPKDYPTGSSTDWMEARYVLPETMSDELHPGGYLISFWAHSRPAGGGQLGVDNVRPVSPLVDEDDDGVPDDDDECPGTPEGAFADPFGCSLSQYCSPDAQWENHGHFVSCVAHIAEQWLESDVITEQEKDALVSEAARSDVGKKEKTKGKNE